MTVCTPIRRPLAALLLLAVATTLSPAPAAAQQAGADEAAATPRKIEPTPPTLVRRIDGGFATAVQYMSQVLFFPLGAEQRTFIEFAPRYYWRPQRPDSTAAFEPLSPGEEAISDAEYRALDALGKLTQKLSRGTLEGEPVEYFAYTPRSGKYVLHDGLFRKTLEREMLSDEETLSKAAVEGLAAEGALKTNDDGEHLLSEKYGGAPIVVLWLSVGAVFFTIYMRFYNFRGFWHAIQIIRGKFDNPDEPGEVTHLQALSSALSATVGLGNIAGVTIAMSAGGPGAFFWMMCCGFFGMSSKFVESTLGQKYRKVNPDGTVRGGPMEYLKDGFAERGMAPIGLVASLLFTVMCVLASFGGGNMFQANQAGQQMLGMLQTEDRQQVQQINHQIAAAYEQKDEQQLVSLQQQRAEVQTRMRKFARWFLPAFGVVFAFLVGVVIIGGIKRIAAAAEKVVPSMCGVYVLACLYIIGANYSRVPQYVSLIFSEAFSPQAFGGGLLGVLILGVRRAAFSNEAGVGSAAIAHSAAKTDEPVREGTVAQMGPFIDTIVVCSMTALVILITGAWNNEDGLGQGLAGSALTSAAFASVIPWFEYVLTVAIVLFAYSTLISWSYYGEKCWETLFGLRSVMAYKVLFVGAVFVGAIANLGAVLEFSDMMILSMAFPNILGLLLLTPSVRRDLQDYWKRYKNGEFKTFK